jgi:hypothetical protein
MLLVAVVTCTLVLFAVLCASRIRYDRAENRRSPRARSTAGFGWRSGEIEARSLKLLREWLSEEQRRCYEERGYFEVIGSDSRRVYRIHRARQMNVKQLDDSGKPICGWCFLPDGNLAAGDVMLAQKVALETDERGAIAVANRFST